MNVPLKRWQCKGRGSGSVGKAVAPDTRGQEFKTRSTTLNTQAINSNLEKMKLKS